MFKTLYFRTEAAIVAHDGEVRARDGYVAFASPNRLHVWGNILVFPSAPTEANAAPDGPGSWEARFEREHPDMSYRGFAWDDGAGPRGAMDAFSTRGYEEDITAVLATDDVVRRKPSARGLTIRRFDRGSDWEQVVLVYADAFGDNRWGTEEQLLAWSRGEVARCRRSQQRGEAVWVGAFVDDELTGACGIARVDDALARYRFVATTPSMQRKGICTALLAAARDEAARLFGATTVVIAADAKGGALSVYENAGFRRVETVCAVLQLPPRA